MMPVVMMIAAAMSFSFMPAIVMVVAAVVSVVATPMIVFMPSPVVPVLVIMAIADKSLVPAAPVARVSSTINIITHPRIALINYNFISMIQIIIAVTIW